MAQEHEVEVRCCCDTRLLGYLPASYGGLVRHTVMVMPDTVVIAAPVGDASERLFVETIDIHMLKSSIILVRRMFRDIHGWAYKSNDYPIEYLREIPGWRDPTDKELSNDPARR